jgi:hypothetical protein
MMINNRWILLISMANPIAVQEPIRCHVEITDECIHGIWMCSPDVLEPEEILIGVIKSIGKDEVRGDVSSPMNESLACDIHNADTSEENPF